MARFVVLRFDDNDMAERFVEEGVTGAKIEGLYAIPTLFCECPKIDDAGIGARGSGRQIAQGEKYGWWVHVKCGRAIEGNYQSPRNLLKTKVETLKDKMNSISIRPLWTFIGSE